MLFSAAECSMIFKTMLPSAKHIAQAGQQCHGSPLNVWQYGKLVWPCSYEAVLPCDTLGDRRNDRLSIKRYAISFGDKSHYFGNVH
jgi:hypothetical protein